MNQYTNYNEPFPGSWDPDTVIANISYDNGTLTLHSRPRETNELFFVDSTCPFTTEVGKEYQHVSDA